MRCRAWVVLQQRKRKGSGKPYQALKLVGDAYERDSYEYDKATGRNERIRNPGLASPEPLDILSVRVVRRTITMHDEAEYLPM